MIGLLMMGMMMLMIGVMVWVMEMKDKKYLEHFWEAEEPIERKCRDVLFEFYLKFWNTGSIGIPARSLL